MVAALEEAMTNLLTTFGQRNNGKMPEHIVVYRDGVGDGQFEEVLDRELPCFQNALAAMVCTRVIIVSFPFFSNVHLSFLFISLSLGQLYLQDLYHCLPKETQYQISV